MHLDMPTRADVERLALARDDHSVTIYLPTSTLPTDAEHNRLAARNLFRTALDTLEAGADAATKHAVAAHLDSLLDDTRFWGDMGVSLALFVTADSIVEFRVPNRLDSLVVVSDRFAIVPLIRAITFSQSAYVLALSQNAVRLVGVSGDHPAVTIDVPDLPTDAETELGLPSLGSRAPHGRIQGDEGKKVRLTQFARAIDHALRPRLNGQSLPLILAGTEPLTSIYRNLTGYTHVVAETLRGNPDELSDAKLAESARQIIDRENAAEVAALLDLFARREAAGRAATSHSDVARAAAQGAIDTLIVALGSSETGTVADDGTLTLGTEPGHNVVEEITRLALRSGARILAVRASDLPEGVDTAAILRYSFS